MVRGRGAAREGGKPEGVAGAEVWVKLIDAGLPAMTNASAMSFLTMTTRPTLRTDFRAAEGGQTAVSMARWVNTSGGARRKRAVVGGRRRDGRGVRCKTGRVD